MAGFSREQNSPGHKKQRAGRGKPNLVMLVSQISPLGTVKKGLFFPGLCSTKPHLHDKTEGFEAAYVTLV